MKFINALVIAMATAVAAKGGNDKAQKDGNSTSTKSQCRDIEKLTALMDIAQNSTELTKITKGNATKAQEIQAKASAGASQLKTLQSNTTLMSACTEQFAADKTAFDCFKMQGLEQLQKIASNQTLLAEKTKNNATKIAEIQAEASSKAGDLKTLQANTTLTATCSVQNDKESCQAMAKISKEQEFAQNTTALNDKFNNNATKVSEFQARVSAKAQKLQTLMSNSTLMDTCSKLGISTASTNSSKSSNSKSAAVNVQALGAGQVLALLSVFVYAVAML